MKKILIFIFIFIQIIAFACSTSKELVKPEDSEMTFGVMMNAFEDYYTLSQFDSICIADNLNPNLQDWGKLKLTDYETKEKFIQYLFIKSLGNNEQIYRVQFVNDSIVKVTKRITK